MFRLFLSVDMVGSTQFKATAAARGVDGWLETFRTFFTNFPLMLVGQMGFEFLDEEETPAVDVWKAMGDEVIFTARPSSPEELVGILRVLLRTMRLYEATHFPKLPLRLKGTAWLADFSENNIALEIPELSSGDASPHLDFIGPDLDLGFRLSKFARPASLVLSLDLVEMLLEADNRSTVAMYLVGREELKGVMFGRPYPIIWMHDAEEGFDFLPWEIEGCPYIASVMDTQPASPEALRRQIDDMRLYLRKMHGLERPPIAFS
ncbi:hypothetical protein [Novosphingobium mangrovi (ex Huang et al. 2023)]|uniref:Uncharacterized protein n=1 Tax=Novosphingobium mangrovi (ex Huang et al. 2023) TaxID=2976432 RepID=A0ABT2I9Q8_9SPHN|nr:hypothetical protein [Novosphingobium mangrovi (ex Huang et al. 2023)]MCT2401526.1 hypothetical protein [Novosphingobium mangrovi (ex Huang et al. 2023)]